MTLAQNNNIIALESNEMGDKNAKMTHLGRCVTPSMVTQSISRHSVASSASAISSASSATCAATMACSVASSSVPASKNIQNDLNSNITKPPSQCAGLRLSLDMSITKASAENPGE